MLLLTLKSLIVSATGLTLISSVSAGVLKRLIFLTSFACLTQGLLVRKEYRHTKVAIFYLINLLFSWLATSKILLWLLLPTQQHQTTEFSICLLNLSFSLYNLIENCGLLSSCLTIQALSGQAYPLVGSLLYLGSFIAYALLLCLHKPADFLLKLVSLTCATSSISLLLSVDLNFGWWFLVDKDLTQVELILKFITFASCVAVVCRYIRADRRTVKTAGGVLLFTAFIGTLISLVGTAPILSTITLPLLAFLEYSYMKGEFLGTLAVAGPFLALLLGPRVRVPHLLAGFLCFWWEEARYLYIASLIGVLALFPQAGPSLQANIVFFNLLYLLAFVPLVGPGLDARPLKLLEWGTGWVPINAKQEPSYMRPYLGRDRGEGYMYVQGFFLLSLLYTMLDTLFSLRPGPFAACTSIVLLAYILNSMTGLRFLALVKSYTYSISFLRLGSYFVLLVFIASYPLLAFLALYWVAHFKSIASAYFYLVALAMFLYLLISGQQKEIIVSFVLPFWILCCRAIRVAQYVKTALRILATLGFMPALVGTQYLFESLYLGKQYLVLLAILAVLTQSQSSLTGVFMLPTFLSTVFSQLKVARVPILLRPQGHDIHENREWYEKWASGLVRKGYWLRSGSDLVWLMVLFAPAPISLACVPTFMVSALIASINEIRQLTYVLYSENNHFSKIQSGSYSIWVVLTLVFYMCAFYALKVGGNRSGYLLVHLQEVAFPYCPTLLCFAFFLKFMAPIMYAVKRNFRYTTNWGVLLLWKGIGSFSWGTNLIMFALFFNWDLVPDHILSWSAVLPVRGSWAALPWNQAKMLLPALLYLLLPMFVSCVPLPRMHYCSFFHHDFKFAFYILWKISLVLICLGLGQSTALSILTFLIFMMAFALVFLVGETLGKGHEIQFSIWYDFAKSTILFGVPVWRILMFLLFTNLIPFLAASKVVPEWSYLVSSHLIPINRLCQEYDTVIVLAAATLTYYLPLQKPSNDEAIPIHHSEPDQTPVQSAWPFRVAMQWIFKKYVAVRMALNPEFQTSFGKLHAWDDTRGQHTTQPRILPTLSNNINMFFFQPNKKKLYNKVSKLKTMGVSTGLNRTKVKGFFRRRKMDVLSQNLGIKISAPSIGKSYVDLLLSHGITYKSPINLTYAWSFGALSGLGLVVQLISGVFLSFQYTADIEHAFTSIERIHRDVSYGWFMRYVHSNGASLFFSIVYLHIFRNILYKLYQKTALWVSGLLIYIVLMATGFLGYVLPWGQMSFWGSVVITNFFSAIPSIGIHIACFIWGGFCVNNATLHRFYTLHFLLPFIIAGISLSHISILHLEGSSQPLGTESVNNISFYPSYWLKDFLALWSYLLVLSYLVFWSPNDLGHPSNYVKANPLVTPPHIVPEWYFLPFYAMLRSVPSKLGGILCMVLALLIPFILPIIDKSRHSYVQARYTWLASYWTWLGLVSLLTWVGSQPVVQPLITIGQLSTCFYFLFFICLVPYNSFMDDSMPL